MKNTFYFALGAIGMLVLSFTFSFPKHKAEVDFGLTRAYQIGETDKFVFIASEPVQDFEIIGSIDVKGNYEYFQKNSKEGSFETAEEVLGYVMGGIEEQLVKEYPQADGVILRGFDVKPANENGYFVAGELDGKSLLQGKADLIRFK